MASIESYETAKGTRYMVRYRKPDGTTTMKRGFRRKTDARNWSEEQESSKNHGEFVEISAGKATVGDLAPAWLAKKKVSSKPSYYHSLDISWKTHVRPVWQHRQVGSITHSEVQSWVSELSDRRSASVVLRAVGILSGIMEGARLDRRIGHNPAKNLDLPRKPVKRHVYLSANELYALSDACKMRRRNGNPKADYMHSVLILVLGTVGLRWGEAAGLRIRDIDFRHLRLHINVSATQIDGSIIEGTPKNGKHRTVVFAKALASSLKTLVGKRSKDELVFTGPLDGHIRQPNTKTHSWFSGAVSRAGLPGMTIHDLRHTAASLMIHAGANVKAVQRQLGHSSASMTLDTYADLFDDDLNTVGDSMNAILLQSALKTRSKTVASAA